MNYSRKDLLQLPDYHLQFDEEIRFGEDTYESFPRIRKLRDVRAQGEGEYQVEQQHLNLHLHVTGIMTCPCDVTLEDVEIPFDSEADEVISFDKGDKDNMEILMSDGDHIDLLPIIFRQILVEVPIKVRKPNLQDLPKGEGWEVISEADYNHERENRIDPRMAALRDYKPQDE